MLRIRLSRIGKRNKAQFRVTVSESRRSPMGRYIEILGFYNPHTKEKVFKEERIKYWLSKGAKPSATIHNFLVDAGIIKEEKVISWKPKKKENKEEKEQKKQETGAEVKAEDKKESKKEEAKAKREDKKDDEEKEKKKETVKPEGEAKQKANIAEKNKKA